MKEVRPSLQELEQAKARLLAELREEIRDERVLAAIARVPRERFVPPDLAYAAYENRPLPIGHGQTISQPLIVGLMTQALGLQGHEKVLEIGTGSGYQAAVLAELAAEVVTVERVEPLARGAADRLAALGYTNVRVYVAGDTLGWPPEAPYHGTIVTAAAPRIPPELLDQLLAGGRLVVPVGPRDAQELILAIKRGDSITTQNLGPCRFVPLVGPGAWAEDLGPLPPF